MLGFAPILFVGDPAGLPRQKIIVPAAPAFVTRHLFVALAVIAGVELELEFGLGLGLELAGRQQRPVVAVAGRPAAFSSLELACSGFAADSFGLVDPAGCFPLVLEYSLAVALLLVGPSLSAVGAGSVSQSSLRGRDRITSGKFL